MRPTLWGLKWVSVNRLDGRREHIIYENCLPMIFTTRRAAREWADKKYGYIRGRLDLIGEPHGWRVPHPIKVKVSEA